MLFIDARKLGVMADRTRKEMTDADVAHVAGTYHAWRGQAEAGAYADVPGFCRAATLEEVRGHGHVLTPGRYVGAADVEDDETPFAERFNLLQDKLKQQFVENNIITSAIRNKLAEIFF